MIIGILETIGNTKGDYANGPSVFGPKKVDVKDGQLIISDKILLLGM